MGHVDRTFVFGSLATQAAGLEVDEEIAYVAAILHDLGLTTQYGGDRRFEIDGADVAKSWALANGMSDTEADHVWHAIALHTSAGIADNRSPECALVHWGAGTDVIGLGMENFPPAALAAVHAAFPREGFAYGIADLLETAALRAPSAYALTFMSGTVNRLCNAGLPSLEEQLRHDPFASAPKE